MKRLALLAIPLVFMPTPALSADLDGPVYRERRVVIERPAIPRVIERERIIERYFEPAPVYTERVYVEPRVYAPPVYGYYDQPYRYEYAGWHQRHFLPRRHWHRHHRHGW
jgi:hypothetical protein